MHRTKTKEARGCRKEILFSPGSPCRIRTMKRKLKWKNIFLLFSALCLVLAAGFGIYFSIQAEQPEKGEIKKTVRNDASFGLADSQEQAGHTDAQPVTGQPTLTDFLRTALIPKDEVLYVWGGGWNAEDTAGNEEANAMGMANSWKAFYEANKAGYNADDHKYEIHNGLDCSGYVGWVLYNTLPVKQNYVVLSHTYDEFLSGLGYGETKPAAQVTEVLPGDIMTSDEGHVYIALGEFEDGSRLLLHASPPGVRMAGTRGIAYETALLYQENGWDPLEQADYLNYDQFRFNENTLPDPDGLRLMSTAQVVDFLYGDPGSQNHEAYNFPASQEEGFVPFEEEE